MAESKKTTQKTKRSTTAKPRKTSATRKTAIRKKTRAVMTQNSTIKRALEKGSSATAKKSKRPVIRKPQASAPQRTVAFADHYELPARYNETKLTLIARDPHWVHAYWEIAPESIDKIVQDMDCPREHCSTVLRMYDVTAVDFNGSNANQWFDVEVGPHALNWDINLWCDNVTSCADIGLRTPDGRFFSLTRSNYVTTPRENLSERDEMMWMEVNDTETLLPFVYVESEGGPTPRMSRGKPGPAGQSHLSRRKIYLTEDDIRAYYSRLFPLLRRILAKRRAKRGRKVTGYRSKEGIWIERSLMKDFSGGEFLKRIKAGASEESALLGGASESIREIMKGGASEKEEQQRKFYFEIGTELIVYGRTEPDAGVFLGDKKIKLRDDGTFTLRFALPDGKIPLDFVAQSHDKIEQRKITTSVVRTPTTSNP